MSTGVQNAQLHDALKAWIQVAAPFMTNRARFQSEDSLLRQLDIDVRHLDTPIQRLEETRVLLDIAARTPEFLSHPVHQPQADAADSNHVDFYARNLMSLFVRAYLIATREADFDLNAFATIYSDLEEYLYRFDEIPIRTTIELWHARPDVPRIAVAPGICIRPITKDEQVQFKTSFPAQLIEIDRRGSLFPYNTEHIAKIYKNSAIALDIEAVQIGHRMLLALRLIREGVIWLGCMRTSSPNRFLESAEEIDMTQVSLREQGFGGTLYDIDAGFLKAVPYVLTDEVARKLSILWPLTPELGFPPIPEKLDLALRRFRASFDRENKADLFIDQWIALEALFSSDQRDATYKMCARLAGFIGADASDSWEIFSNAKASYRARSDIVHGRELNRRDFVRHAGTAENCLRRSLVKCLESGQMPDKKALERQWDLQHASPAQNL